MTAATHRVLVGDAELHVEVEGAGFPVFVVGSVGMECMQYCLSERLREVLQLVFIDLRGSGRSTGELASFTPAVLLDDVEAVRRVLGYDAVAVLGHSANGRVGLEFARRYPASVSRVICVGTPPELGAGLDAVRAYWREHAEPERLAIGEAALAENTPESLQRFDAVRRWYEIGFDAGPIEALYRLGSPGWFQKVFVEGFAGPSPVGELTCPVLFAMGKYDFLVPPVLLEGVVLPAGSRVVVFDRSGHSPFFEAQRDFDTALIEWLGLG